MPRIRTRLDALRSTEWSRAAPPTKLNDPLPIDTDVDIPRVSPTGEYLVYNITNAAGQLVGSYVSRTDGSSPGVVVSPPKVAVSIGLTWSTDGTYLALMAGPTFQELALYTVRPDGTDLQVVDDGPITFFSWSPAENRLGYLSTGSGDAELFTALADGSGKARLHPDLPALQSVRSFEWAPDGIRVMYLADQFTPGVPELFSSRYDGDENRQLNGTPITGGSVRTAALSPDGTTIAYAADEVTAGVVELFTVPLDGSQPSLRITPAPEAARTLSTYQWSPDSTRILYRGDFTTPGTVEVFSTTVTGNDTRQVNHDLKGAYVTGATWSPDSANVAYVVEELEGKITRAKLYLASATGENPTQLSLGSTNYRFISELNWSKDGQRIAYRANTNSSFGMRDLLRRSMGQTPSAWVDRSRMGVSCLDLAGLGPTK